MSALDEFSVWTEREKMGKNHEALTEFCRDLIDKVQRIDPIVHCRDG